MMRHARTVLFVPILALLLTACGGRGHDEVDYAPTGPSVFEGGGKARSVTITYDGLEDDRVERLEAYEGPSILQSDIESRLTQAGLFGSSGDLEVRVHLDEFRLRSSAAAFWLGYMAGADKVVADVRVLRGGQEIKNFRTDTSTILGGFVYSSASRRIRRLSDSLATRIFEGL